MHKELGASGCAATDTNECELLGLLASCDLETSSNYVDPNGSQINNRNETTAILDNTYFKLVTLLPSSFITAATTTHPQRLPSLTAQIWPSPRLRSCRQTRSYCTQRH